MLKMMITSNTVPRKMNGRRRPHFSREWSLISPKSACIKQRHHQRPQADGAIIGALLGIANKSLHQQRDHQPCQNLRAQRQGEPVGIEKDIIVPVQPGGRITSDAPVMELWVANGIAGRAELYYKAKTCNCRAVWNLWAFARNRSIEYDRSIRLARFLQRGLALARVGCSGKWNFFQVPGLHERSGVFIGCL